MSQSHPPSSQQLEAAEVSQLSQPGGLNQPVMFLEPVSDEPPANVTDLSIPEAFRADLRQEILRVYLLYSNQLCFLNPSMTNRWPMLLILA
ncbi:hypothetical protein RRG08_025830 [Elysia crispata]|uniref:Uncharacterized protein n=1 Tax=Elysia crispata TaxID=231223 RepID=A0AAE0Y3H1_9GAST|nr:hypothetical protein RRG08_025830 [Elysia crispata]